jgi:hypothetical protein
MANQYVPVRSGTGLMVSRPNASSVQIDSDDTKLKFKDSGNALRAVVTENQTQTLTNKTLTAPTITSPTVNGVAQDRFHNITVFPLAGATIQAAVTPAIQFPADAIIERVLCDVTTVATGACTLDIGYTASSATTGSDTLLDGIDVNAATALFDSMNAALDAGSNAKAQKAASGKWITVQSKTGDATGLVGNLYIFWTKL